MALPTELRLKMWKFLRPRHRLIRLSLKEGDFRSTAILPIGLQICKESREVTLRSYKLRIAVEPSNARIYINTKYDALQLLIPRDCDDLATYCSLLTMACAAIKKDIKVVFIDCEDFVEILNARPAALKAGPDKPSLTPLFGPDCQVFVLQKQSELIRHIRSQPLSHKLAEESPFAQKMKSVFGARKIDFIWRDEFKGTMAERKDPLIEQNWTNGSDELDKMVNRIVKPYVKSLKLD
ncbi:hypothetical protein NHQ30_004325 [Ciborinia camelliae]|nr:hypothetical protein NHQ30_004325 [Ciborinia camelliae]